MSTGRNPIMCLASRVFALAIVHGLMIEFSLQDTPEHMQSREKEKPKATLKEVCGNLAVSIPSVEEFLALVEELKGGTPCDINYVNAFTELEHVVRPPILLPGHQLTPDDLSLCGERQFEKIKKYHFKYVNPLVPNYKFGDNPKHPPKVVADRPLQEGPVTYAIEYDHHRVMILIPMALLIFFKAWVLQVAGICKLNFAQNIGEAYNHNVGVYEHEVAKLVYELDDFAREDEARRLKKEEAAAQVGHFYLSSDSDSNSGASSYSDSDSGSSVTSSVASNDLEDDASSAAVAGAAAPLGDQALSKGANEPRDAESPAASPRKSLRKKGLLYSLSRSAFGSFSPKARFRSLSKLTSSKSSGSDEPQVVANSKAMDKKTKERKKRRFDRIDFYNLVYLPELEGEREPGDIERRKNPIMKNLRDYPKENLFMHACKYVFKPIYDKLVMPIVRLAVMGYDYQGAQLDFERSALEFGKEQRLWMAITHYCEKDGAFKLVEQADKFQLTPVSYVVKQSIQMSSPMWIKSIFDLRREIELIIGSRATGLAKVLYRAGIVGRKALATIDPHRIPGYERNADTISNVLNSMSLSSNLVSIGLTVSGMAG